MTTQLKLILVAVALSVAACGDDIEVAAGSGVTGTWHMEVEATSPSGPGRPIFGLIQNGEEITGNYKGAYGKAPVTGTIKGNIISFSFTAADVDTKYSGTVTGDSMSGNVSMGTIVDAGTFTGTRYQSK
jgi:hypothetical protein